MTMTTMPTTNIDNDDNDFFELDLPETSNNVANDVSTFTLK